MTSIIAIIIAYVLGSLSAAIIAAKITKSPDPRSGGSENAGATNVLRTAGKQQALFVLIGDTLKGLIAVVIGHAMGVHGFMLGLVAVAVVVGHIFPIFFQFKGGKGVATAIGAVFMLSPTSGIIMSAGWVLTAFITRYASLASLIAVILAPIMLIIFSKASYLIPGIIIALLVIWKHKANIIRLQNKTESKIVM